MSGVSVSHLVLFIASLVVAAGVAGTLVTEVGNVTSSVDGASEDVSDVIETDISIISDTGSDALYDDSTSELTLLVKNTGRTTLQVNQDSIQILIDGRFVEAGDYITIERADGSGETLWREETVLRIVIDAPNINIGDDVRVTARANDNEDTITFQAS